jgi:hypothetical protein
VTATQTFPKDSTGNERAGYGLIAGTPHDRVRKMLKDYRKTMKDLKIQVFHVMTPNTKVCAPG